MSVLHAGKSAICVLAAVGLLLSACSSSSNNNAIPVGSTSPPPPPPPPPSSGNFDTLEYRSQPGLELMNTLPAYDAGASGAGVIVSIIDTGIDVNNPEFQGRIHPQSADLVAPGIVSNSELRSGGPNLQDTDDHGTPVASIIGAARNGIGVHGVAPEAQLLIFRADDESADETLLGDAIVEGVIRSSDIGADVLNLSFGSDEAGARAEFASIFDFTKQHDIVTVTSAGNDAEADPDQSALGALDVAGAPATIIAGAADSVGNIASFSNRAGPAANIFLLAPGSLISTTFVGANSGETRRFSGTSAAAPHISGAAALIRHLWPQLTASEVVEILLDSATDLGAPGPDAIYGRGMLNVGAAVSPLGSITTSSIDGAVSTISDFGAQLSSPFGVGMTAISDIVVFDAYNRDFRTSIAGEVNAPPLDSFAIEAVFNPFDQYDYASKRINNMFSADMRLTSRDRSLTDYSSNITAAFSGVDARNDLVDETIAVALISEFGSGQSLTVAQGFTSTAVDRMILRTRQTPFLTQAAFTDAYLPEAKTAITAMMRSPITRRISADFLISYSYAFYPENFDALGDASLSPERQASAVRVGLSYDLPNAHFRIEQGLRQETGAILDATFGENTSAETLYGAVEGEWALSPKWQIKGRYAAGYTFAGTDGFGGLVDGFSNIISSQFSISVARLGIFNDADNLWIGVSQPLQIQSGYVRMTLPTGYNQFTDTLSFSTLASPLAPDDGRLDLEAGYRLHTSQLGSVDLNLIHQTFADSTMPDLTTLLLRSGFRF